MKRLHYLLHWPKKLTVVLLTSVLIVTAAQCSGPKNYEVSAKVRVRPAMPAWSRPWDDYSSLPAYRGLIKSSIVIDAALAMPGVSELPWITRRKGSKSEAKWLAEEIQVRKAKKDKEPGDILLISMQGDDSRQLVVLVNAVTEAYIEKVAGEERRVLVARQKLLEETFQTKSQEVERRRELVHKLEERLGAIDEKKAKDERQAILEELQRRKEDVEAVETTAKKLRATLDAYEVELRSPDRATLLQEASIDLPKTEE